jgi:hypothetical protein
VIEASYPRKRWKTRENKGKLLDKPNSYAIVSTLKACILLFILILVCVVRFCAHITKAIKETVFCVESLKILQRSGDVYSEAKKAVLTEILTSIHP